MSAKQGGGSISATLLVLKYPCIRVRSAFTVFQDFFKDCERNNLKVKDKIADMNEYNVTVVFYNHNLHR